MKYCLSFLLLLLLAGCQEKKIDLSGEMPLSFKEFLTVFPKITPPYLVADTNISKAADTTAIGYKALKQFFPDSVLQPLVGNSKKTLIHPVGIIEKGKENYLVVSITNAKKNIQLLVLVTDKKNNYLASKELLNSPYDDGYLHSVSINREPTFLISKEKMGSDNSMRFSRTGWVYASTGEFMVVINDSNEDPIKSAIINPIDTLSKKNKLSGDYVQDKKNYISIRDTKHIGKYEFFIHFEKNEGACKGELKGEMLMLSPTTARFSMNGDPCVIDFKFDGNEVRLKEQGSCGNHRGIKCYFDDSFTKKKDSPRKKK